MRHQTPPAPSPQELGFYSIGLRPVTVDALERFVADNAVPALDLRAGRRGFALLDRPAAEGRALLSRLDAAAPVRMIASDVDLGDVASADRHEGARASIAALDALLSDAPACPIRLLGRHVPQPAELGQLLERTALWPARALLLELHDPAWFHPDRTAPWRLCADWPGLGLLADSEQIAQAISRHGPVPVAASLAAMRNHIAMVHLCDPGGGLDRDATDMIAQTLFHRSRSCPSVAIGVEFTGPDRSARRAARAYADARTDWHHSIASLHKA